MAYDERARLALLQRLEQLLGEETARTMMEHLPPTGWDDLATKGDLEQLRVATKGDLEQLRVATKGDLEQLRAATRSDLESLTSDTNHGFELLRTEMAKGFADLRADFRGEINAAITSQTRSMIFAVLGAVVVMTGLVLGLARPV